MFQHYSLTEGKQRKNKEKMEWKKRKKEKTRKIKKLQSRTWGRKDQIDHEGKSSADYIDDTRLRMDVEEE